MDEIDIVTKVGEKLLEVAPEVTDVALRAATYTAASQLIEAVFFVGIAIAYGIFLSPRAHKVCLRAIEEGGSSAEVKFIGGALALALGVILLLIAFFAMGGLMDVTRWMAVMGDPAPFLLKMML